MVPEERAVVVADMFGHLSESDYVDPAIVMLVDRDVQFLQHSNLGP